MQPKLFGGTQSTSYITILSALNETGDRHVFLISKAAYEI